MINGGTFTGERAKGCRAGCVNTDGSVETPKLGESIGKFAGFEAWNDGAFMT